MAVEPSLSERGAFVRDLVDPDKGYVLLREWFTPEAIDAYREECLLLLRTARRRHTRINTGWVADYVHPRSHDGVERTFRIYQYLHNIHGARTTAFFARALELRNEIERTWHNDPLYFAESRRLQDYVIVTSYLEDTGCLPRHRDYVGPAPRPLLQSLVCMTRRPQDYTGGEFTLYPRQGRPVRLHADLGAGIGDLLLFDKSLDHEVETTGRGDGRNLGRWTVLVGARAERDSWIRAFLKYALCSEPYYSWTSPLAGVVRRIGLPI